VRMPHVFSIRGRLRSEVRYAGVRRRAIRATRPTTDLCLPDATTENGTLSRQLGTVGAPRRSHLRSSGRCVAAGAKIEAASVRGCV
jgi:hypothetical protein